MKPQLAPGPAGIRDVALRLDTGQRELSNVSACGSSQCGRNLSGDFGDGEGALRTHVVRPAGLPPNQDRPEPDGQIGGVKIRAISCAVAANLNGPRVQTIADEITDREVRAQRQVRSNESEATSDGAL